MNVFLEEYRMHFPDLWQILGSSQIAEVTTLVALTLSLLKARTKLPPNTTILKKPSGGGIYTKAVEVGGIKDPLISQAGPHLSH
jgi:hypothetical protein